MTLTAKPTRFAQAAPALIAAALAIALYAITLGGTYIYDDVQIILHDTRMQPPIQWGQFWTKDYFNGGIDNLYRPLTSLSFAAEWWLLGDRPWAFHLVNLLLHAAVAASVAELARRLAGKKVAFIAGLLFAAHPVHVEAVAGIVGRAEELCTLLMLVAMILFLHSPMTLRRTLAIGVCFIAAMLAKEQGMLLPFMLLTLAICTNRRAQSPREKAAFDWLKIVMCFPLAGLIYLREQVLNLKFEWNKAFLDVAIQPLMQSGPKDRALMPFVILGHYTQLLIAPLKLSIDYGMNVMTSVASPRDPYFYLGLATTAAGIIALILAARRRQWTLLFCLIAAALTYAMISNVLLIGDIFAERLIYLPSVFVLIWAAMYLTRSPTKPLVAIMTIVLLLYSIRTTSYAARWNDRMQFYLTSLADQPKSARLYELVAKEMLDRGDLPGAARVTADGLKVVPQYWNMWYCAGLVAEKQGDLDRAIAMYQKAFDLEPLSSLDLALHKVRYERSHPNGP